MLRVLGIAPVLIAGLFNKAFATDVRPIVYVSTSQTSLKMVSVWASGVETALKRGLEIRAAESRFGPPAVADRQMGNQGNVADSIVRKMAAGRKCHRHSRSLSNCIWYYRESKNMCNTVGPSGRRSPVVSAGCRPSTLLKMN